MAPSLAEATKLFIQFKDAFAKNDLPSCSRLLSLLKLKLTEFPSLPPFYVDSPTAKDELLFAREVMEHGVVLSVRLKDESAFERNFLQLNTYYTDTQHLLPPSPQELPMRGLHLLCLLVQNRIAEFHSQLELLAPDALSHACILMAVELEQSLMEGAYSRVLNARQHVPDPTYIHFMDLLMLTVRDEIADCSEKAYETLTAEDASKLLMISSAAELSDYSAKHGWDIKDGRVVFGKDDSRPPHKEIPSMHLISQSLGYARELERIV